MKNLKRVFPLASSILLLLVFAKTPLALAAGPFAYVTDSGGYPYTSPGTVSVIDTSNNSVVATITVGTQPYGIAVTPDGSHVYVANEGYGTDLGSISVIDTSTNTATTPTNLSYTGGEISIPIGIAVTPNGASVYVTNFGTDTVAVIATATNTVTATIPVGGGPSRVAITPDGTKAYVSNEFGGTVSVINTATNTLVGGPISVGSSPAGVAITPNGAYAYVANFGSNDVSVIATATNTVTSTIPVGSEPLDLAVTPNGTSVYVTNYYDSTTNDGTVSVIATASNTVSATITLGAYYLPFGIGISGDGTKAYVVELGTFGVAVIDTATQTVTGSPISVGENPYEIAIQAPTPAQQVTNLITEISTLNLGLLTGEVKLLTETLDVTLAAVKRVAQGASGPGGQGGVNVAKFVAIASLRVFIAELTALVHNGTLNAQSAASMISVANSLISAL